MERIKLSKNAKAVFRLIKDKQYSCPDYMMQPYFNDGAIELQTQGFVICHEEENGDVEIARFSDKGRIYYKNNPRLLNPINWAKISAIAAIVSALLVAVGFLIACTKL